MSETKRVGDLEISEDVQFQRRSWRVERVGWLIGALILLASLVGLLGPGPLSRATAGGPDSALRVEYNRFERYQSPVRMRVHVQPPLSPDGKLRLWLNRSYVESVEIQHIQPEPESVAAGEGRFIFTFLSTGAPTTITFHVEASEMFRLPVSIGLDGGPELNFTQFIFP